MKSPNYIHAVLKIIANEHRYAIASFLMESKDAPCVNQISDAVSLPQPRTSQYLSQLEARGIVNGMRHGQTTCYQLVDTPKTRLIIKLIKTTKKYE